MEENKDQVKKSEIAKKEEEILKFWQENKIFEKTLEKDSPQGEFVFYDGPPFATGTPHYGHLIAGTIKDVIPRYKTMQGYHVSRRWGWDCHGLPVENLIEKELDLKTKKDIEDYGIGNFNEKARESVMRYADEWKTVVPRLGRFVDMDNDYRTMDPSYTESIWWIFKNLYDQGLIYEGYKAMQICPRCETTLSNFEVNQGYKDITDISVFVKFKIKKGQNFNDFVLDDNTYIVAWTTTPWTLPGNVALAVGKDIDYVLLKAKSEKLEADGTFILAKSRLESVFKDGEYEIIEEVKGADLIGKKYQPIFDYYAKDETLKNNERGWKIYGADFVTTGDGTGVVHIAPAFGEDDMKLGQKENLPFVQHVAMNGAFKPEVGDGLAGLRVKPIENPQATDIEIIKILAAKGSLLAKEKIVHSYPHCWRCETPLLNYATSSWFVEVTKIKDKLVAENKKINWVPEHIQEGRFGKWLEGARDWAISRTRFWGAPLPVWRCEACQEKKVFGSLAELQSAMAPAKNNYLVMRHGQATSNPDSRISFQKEAEDGLTETGREEVLVTAKTLADKKIDLIVTSPFRRTKETADILAEELGAPIEIADGLKEINAGVLDGQSWLEYEKALPTIKDKMESAPEGGETVTAMKARVMAVLFELEQKYTGKNILIITHGLPLRVMLLTADGQDNRTVEKNGWANTEMTNAEVRPLSFKIYPHNADFDLDYHRPYIDDITTACACGGQMKRVPDVFDCWFESGSMPYGQNHYPFEKEKGGFDPDQRISFPADFIAEGQDQTRGWFYTMLILGTALFGQSPYKNVVVNGLILAEDGQKMSKRLKNYPDPLDLTNKYGADALRLYLMSSPAVHAEDLNFSEKGVGEIQRKIISRLLNVVTFLETYGEVKGGEIRTPKTDDILDRWILSRLGEMITKVEKEFDGYELDRAVWALDDFIDDLSNWYLRRSRDRFRGDNQTDRDQANQTLLFVLLNTAKILAPLAPFVADDIYLRLTKKQAKDSVHLESWPEIPPVESDLLSQMSVVRKIVTLGLEFRMMSGFKVRQPLSQAVIADQTLVGREDLLSLIKDELNVKDIIFGNESGEVLWLNTNITPELKQEGIVRDIIRLIQEKRKQEGFVPIEKAGLEIFVDKQIVVAIEDFQAEIKRVANISSINFLSNQPEIKADGSIEEWPIWIMLEKEI